MRDGRGQGRTGDEHDCMAVAPAQRAGLDNGLGAAATVVFAIAKGVCLRGAGMEVTTIKKARMEAAGIEEARLEEAR